jgi:DNA-binding MarR family transcriptional regulator
VRHIDRLETEGLVRRTRDPRDRRITRITLTAKGSRRLDSLRAVMDEQDRRMRAQLTAAEARTLQRALGKLHAYAASAAANDLDPSSANPSETDVA